MYLLFCRPRDTFLSLIKEGSSAICLRRVTFANSGKSNQKRHSRGKGFQFSFPLEKPPTLKRPKREGCGPPSLETPSVGRAIIKSRLCREAAKGGGGRWPPFEKQSCYEIKNRTALHFRTRAAAKREAETIQHLGEISAVQRSRGENKQDKQRVKARKGFSNRRFERRFGYFCRRGQKSPAPGRGMSLFDNPSVTALP